MKDNTIINFSFCLLLSFVCVLITQSCLTLCDPMDYHSPPGSSVHGILWDRRQKYTHYNNTRSTVYLLTFKNLTKSFIKKFTQNCSVTLNIKLNLKVKILIIIQFRAYMLLEPKQSVSLFVCNMYWWFLILFEALLLLTLPTITNTYGSPFFQSCAKDVSLFTWCLVLTG